MAKENNREQSSVLLGDLRIFGPHEVSSFRNSERERERLFKIYLPRVQQLKCYQATTKQGDGEDLFSVL
jgi:hypothetical protein